MLEEVAEVINGAVHYHPIDFDDIAITADGDRGRLIAGPCQQRMGG